MNSNDLVRGLALAALTLIPLAPTWGQDAEQEKALPPVILSVSDIVLTAYEVQHQDRYEVRNVANGLVGRQFLIRERGGESGFVSNLDLLGDSILIYDTPEYVARVVETLRVLDQPRAGVAAKLAAEPDVSMDYRPRYISLETARDSIGSFVDLNRVVSFQREGILSVRAGREAIEAARRVLELVDQPRPSVMLSAYLLRASQAGEASSGVPAEVLEPLSKMLPGFEYELLGISLLNATIVAGESLSATIDQGDGSSYQLRFEPVAYDLASGDLTLRDCELMSSSVGVTRHIFTTNTTLRGSEYTVLGAAGREPVLVVLRLSREE